MLMELQVLEPNTATPLLDGNAAERDLSEPASGVSAVRRKPTVNDATPVRIVLKRGPTMMVLFRGCPGTSTVDQLRQAGVAIGLALASRELGAVRGFNDFNYVFVRVQRRGRSILDDAVADLEGNGWLIDDTPDRATDRPRVQPTQVLLT